MRVLVALAVLVAAEIAVLVAVGGRIGFLGLLGVLVGSALLGSWAITHEGRRSLAALVATARSGRPAEAEVADGMLIALAGVLLVLPGLVSDVAALVLLVPPVRRVLAARMVASARRRSPVVRVVDPARPSAAGPAGRPPAPRPRAARPAPGGARSVRPGARSSRGRCSAPPRTCRPTTVPPPATSAGGVRPRGPPDHYRDRR